MPTVDQYRSDLDELVRLANLDLRALAADIVDGRVAAELLRDILPELTAVYGAAAGALAADWYDNLRAEQNVTGRFTARVADLPDQGRTDALARWAVEPLFSPDPDAALTLDRTEGGLQRIIADVGRETVMQSSIADPQARGWQRVASRGCGFCRLLADRGTVYSESTVRFGAHDKCRCAAVPAFGGRELPVHPHVSKPPASEEAREQARRDRARTYRWMRENGYL